MKWLVLGLLAVFLLAGCIAEDKLDYNCPECPEDLAAELDDCQDSVATVTATLKDSRDYFKAQLEDKQAELEAMKEVGSKAFEDYWQCYLAYMCDGQIDACNDGFEQGYEEENHNYAITICSLAQNYDEYYETFGGD